VTLLHTGELRNRVSIPGKSKIFTSSPKRPYRLWGLPMGANRNRGPILPAWSRPRRTAADVKN
jgi:hypothetical protein